ncbi:MAG: diguanylate cyclase [Pseudomonadota bacterium]|nr:diguanylate cyclase [Pseudomonadota bacterium]
MSKDLEAQVALMTDELGSVREKLRACRESHERNLSALCAIAEGIAIVDNSGRITCLNPAASHLTGWKEHASLGRSLSKVVKFTDNQGRSLDVLSEGFSSDHEEIVSLVRRDGHVILVDGTVAQVQDSEKQAIGTVITFRNVTASTRLTRELTYHANHDALTGLHNRRAFKAQLQRAIAHAAESGGGNALLYIDLDQFKVVNDRGGHAAGDELLRQLAVLLRKQLRGHDTVARLGGDEFVVLLENCTEEHAATVAEKIRTAIVNFRFVWHQRTYQLGASIGQMDFSDGERSVEQLIRVADRMCYVAKTNGRNQVTRYGAKEPDAEPDTQDVSHRPGSRRSEGELLQ